MNRLIIIGNGFDLAHHLKTSYHDFIFNYVKKSFIIAVEKGIYKDDLVEIQQKYSSVSRQNIEGLNNLGDFIAFLNPNPNDNWIIVGDSEPYGKRLDTGAITWKIKSDFIRHLFTVCHECNWVDIENEYYDALKKILDSNSQNPKKGEALEKLNASFKYLIDALENYLSQILPPQEIEGYNEIFRLAILKEDVVADTISKDQYPKNTLILNFNFTTTTKLYCSDQNYTKDAGGIKINNIHGQLKNASNPIIFGFGDELDTDYYKIESAKLKGFLRYIKSFSYFRTLNYHELLKFIGWDSFQVFILGHSCGLSDRTMLNMIFEHPNCESIKIFYHNNSKGNNYTELTQEISRHFNSKTEMRRKVVPFPNCSAMPQAIA